MNIKQLKIMIDLYSSILNILIKYAVSGKVSSDTDNYLVETIEFLEGNVQKLKKRLAQCEEKSRNERGRKHLNPICVRILVRKHNHPVKVSVKKLTPSEKLRYNTDSIIVCTKHSVNDSRWRNQKS